MHSSRNRSLFVTLPNTVIFPTIHLSIFLFLTFFLSIFFSLLSTFFSLFPLFRSVAPTENKNATKKKRNKSEEAEQENIWQWNIILWANATSHHSYQVSNLLLCQISCWASFLENYGMFEAFRQGNGLKNDFGFFGIVFVRKITWASQKVVFFEQAPVEAMIIKNWSGLLEATASQKAVFDYKENVISRS